MAELRGIVSIFTTALLLLCSCSCANTDISNVILEESPNDIKKVPFRLRHVSKEKVAGGYKVKVDYEGYLEPTVTVAAFESMFMEPLDKYGTLDGERRTVVLTLTGEYARSGVAILSFLAGNIAYGLELNLSNDSSSEENLPLVEMTFPSGNDVRSLGGGDAEVKLTIAVEDEDGRKTSFQTFFWKAFAIPQTEERAVAYHEYNYDLLPFEVPFMERPSAVLTEKGVALHLLLKDAGTDMNAIFALTIGFRFENCDDYPTACLVQQITVSRQLNLYRSDLEGPLPVGFGAFAEEASEQEAGKIKYCYVGERTACTLAFTFISYEKAQLDVRKEGSDSEVTFEVLSTKMAYGYLYQAVVAVEHPDYLDSGEYTCTALSQVRAFRQTLTLDVVKAAEIDRERSNMTMMENGSLEIICVADGFPAPNVLITAFSTLGQITDSDETLSTTQDQNQTVARLIINNPVSELTDIVFFAGCTAFSSDPTKSDIYYLIVDTDWPQ